MDYTLGTNTTGYSYPGASTYRSLVPTHWDNALWDVVRDKLILKDFIGPEGSGKPIITKNELKKAKGDTIRLAMAGNLTGAGKFGNTTLEGYEESINQYYVDVYVNHLRHATLDHGELSRQRDKYDLNKIMVKKLGEWWAERVERDILNALYYGYSSGLLATVATVNGLGINSSNVKPNKNWYCADSANNSITYSATDTTYIANIKAAEQAMTNNEANYFGPQVLEGVAAKLKVLNIPPAKYKGWEGYIGLIHPYQTAQLRSNADWFNANIQAMPVGDDKNPIFTGRLGNMAVGRWANIMLFESTLVHSGDQSYFYDLIGAYATAFEIDSDAPNVYRALFLGAEAGAIAEAVAPHYITKGDFDFNNYEGHAVSGIYGAQRCDFKSDDGNSTIINQGSLVVSTYSPATSI